MPFRLISTFQGYAKQSYQPAGVGGNYEHACSRFLPVRRDFSLLHFRGQALGL